VQEVEDSEDQRVPDREQRIDGPYEDRVEDLLPQGDSRPPARGCSAVDLVEEGDAAVAVNLDDPHRLLDVVVRRELERTERGLDVYGLHSRPQLVAVAGQVGESEVGALGGVGNDLDGRVALRRELVRVLGRAV